METLSHKIGTPDDVTNSAKASAEIAFTSALYNSFAIAFMIIAILLCGLLLIVLQAFVRSILWAVLTGAFLFKFKRYSTDITREHLKLIEANDASLLFSLVMLPLKLIDSTSEYLFNFCVKKYRQLGYLIIAVVTFKLVAIFYDHVVVYIWYIFDRLLEVTNIFAYCVDNSWQITLTVLVAYLFLIAFYWRDDYKPIFKILSIPIWICFSILISKYLGSFRVLFVIAAIILILLGVVSFIKEQIIKHKKKLMKVKADILGDESMKSDDDENLDESNKSDSTALNGSTNQENEQQIRPNSLDITNSDDKVNDNTKPEASASNKSRILERSVSASFYNYNSKSDKYFYLLFWLFLGIRLWSFTVLLAAVFIFLWKFIKCVLIRLSNFLYKRFEIEKIIAKFKDWITERQDVLAPKPLNVVYKLFIKGDHKLNEWLQTSLDAIVSALMIFALLVCLISGLVILAMQVHSESLDLISITSNVVNEKLYSQPQLQEWLPEKKKVNELFQTAINNFYVYGREWLSNRLKNLATTTSDQEMIENKLLAQWDLLYTFVMQKTSSNLTNNTIDVHIGNNATSSSHILTTSSHNRTVLTRQRSFDLKNTWNFIISKENFDYSYLIDVIKGNIGILVSLLDSIYLVLKSNINILFTLIQLFVSLLFQSGFALLNFFISLIVYLTALFYLLSASEKRYKPIQWINEITIIKGNRGHLMSKAIEESIGSVFVASLKMATFYGLYTWIIHNLFSLNIVYLPSITAALFGFLPILGTYWTCLPGVLELWLLQKKPFYALLFIICNILPTYVVDMAIYSDIKGGHPYLTGLAIAGGLYCLGLEGALIGPIVLCLFIVIIKMNKELLSLNILKQ